MENGNNCQYLVFQLSDTGLAGKLTSLRIDWEKAANEAGNTAYLADIFFVATEEQADALAMGQYIFPVQPVIVPETEAPTEEATNPESAPDADTSETDATETEAPEWGCKASVGMTAAILAACAAFVLVRKKED